LNPVVRETAIITFWTFWTSAGFGALMTLVLGWPLTATYMMAVLTIGPALAILRGRNRDKDRLELSERAGAELLTLVILLAIGWAAGHYLGK
jgi:hypothetical protein